MTTSWYKSFSKIVILLVVFLLIPNFPIASADKQEWIDKSYNFSNVKRVLLLDPTIEPKLYNGVNEHEIIDIFEKNAKLPKNIAVITRKNIIENIKRDSGIDIDVVNQTNKHEALRLFDEGIMKYSDIVIASCISEYGTCREYREGYTYSTTTYHTSYIYGSNGSSVATSVPVSEIHSIPGGNINVAYASVRWDIKDVQSSKIIMTRLDNRTRDNGTEFDNTKPRDLYKRISSSFFDFISDKFEKKDDE